VFYEKGGKVMKLNDTVRSMLEHPIASTMIIGSIINGVVRIISAAKGCDVKPNTVITIGKPAEPKEDSENT